MNLQPLQAGWTLRLAGGHVPESMEGPIPAIVPGTVHTDLVAAGLIPDPYLGVNEELLQWIGDTDATYTTSFDWIATDEERVDLVVAGLDTVATITLNGALVARTLNQHRSYRFDVGALLQPGSNEMVVAFDAPLRAARESEERIGAMPVVADLLPWNALRKMGSNFGTDFGPLLTTSGIWKPIGLQTWSTARISDTVPRVTVVRNGDGQIDVSVNVERTADATLHLSLRVFAPDGAVVAVADLVPVASAVTILRADVTAPHLWWPRGHGDQPLYRVEINLLADGRELDSWTRDVGFRTVELRMEPDEFGTSFQFRINDSPVWVRGANWITADCFPSRLIQKDYERLVRDVVDARMNMVRVWGGGIYESDQFYELCDRHGVMVWQDFPFNCATYSEAPEMFDEVEAEAREHVARLASHPSLVVWNGGNEHIEGYYNWGFKELLAPGQAWGRGYWDELLPQVVADVDGTRPYIPSSPFNPADETRPTDPDHGPVHSWKVWYTADYLTYRNVIPRFVAEFGFQGPAAWSTLLPATQDDEPSPDSPGMAAHQKSLDGNDKLALGWQGHLPTPTTFDDWYFTTQLAQVRAITTAVAHYRSHAPRNSGYIVWMLNDCWPAVSWSLVDHAGQRKPLWFALRALNAPRVLLLQPRGGCVALIISNDTDDAWSAGVLIQRLDVEAKELASHEIDITVGPRSTSTIDLPGAITSPLDPTREFVVAQVTNNDTGRAWWWFAEDVDTAFPTPRLRTDVTRTLDGYDVIVTALTLVKEVALFPDRLNTDAVVDDLLVTLLPGENHTFHVTTATELDTTALTQAPVLRSTSELCTDITEAERP